MLTILPERGWLLEADGTGSSLFWRGYWFGGFGAHSCILGAAPSETPPRTHCSEKHGPPGDIAPSTRRYSVMSPGVSLPCSGLTSPSISKKHEPPGDWLPDEGTYRSYHTTDLCTPRQRCQNHQSHPPGVSCLLACYEACHYTTTKSIKLARTRI